MLIESLDRRVNLLESQFPVQNDFLAAPNVGALPAQTTAVSGRWLVTADFYGTPLHYIMDLGQQKDALTGKFDGNKLEGALVNGALKFLR